MNIAHVKAVLSGRRLLAVFSGLVFAAAFPKIGIAGAAWLAPGLLLFLSRGRSSNESFKLGYLAGLTWFLGALYWLLLIPFRVFGMPLGPAVGWIALSAYLALYPAVWAWLCSKLFRKFVEPPPVQNAGGKTGNEVGDWLKRAAWAISCAIVWVALEMIVARFLSGFPWLLLGISQYKLWPILQIAAYTGVYGVSFLIVWFSVSLCSSALVLVKTPSRYRAWTAEIILPLTVVCAIWVWGYNRATAPIPPKPELKLALIQPSIEQQVIWDESKTPERFKLLMELSRKALTENPDVLIWPEAALPGFSVEHFSAITNLIVTNQVWMILGADDAERKVREGEGESLNFYNASFLFNPEGQYVSTYRKLRLVMFGEYIPFSRQLPFLQKLIPIGNFDRGEGPVQFKLNEPAVQTAVLICFEDVFPHFTRRYVEADTDFLLNLTNDGWFGDSAAQWQHAAIAFYRTVENGIPLVRCTNNGLTCWIDEFGRLRQYLGRESRDVYGPGYLIVNVPLLDSGEERQPTFYNRHGDWFGWGCVIAAVLLGLAMRFLKTNS